MVKEAEEESQRKASLKAFQETLDQRRQAEPRSAGLCRTATEQGSTAIPFEDAGSTVISRDGNGFGASEA